MIALNLLHSVCDDLGATLFIGSEKKTHWAIRGAGFHIEIAFENLSAFELFDSLNWLIILHLIYRFSDIYEYYCMIFRSR